MSELTGLFGFVYEAMVWIGQDLDEFGIGCYRWILFPSSLFFSVERVIMELAFCITILLLSLSRAATETPFFHELSFELLVSLPQ